MWSKTLLSETALPETAVTTKKETAPWFIEGVIAAHPVPKANEDMAGIDVESSSDATDYRPPQPLKPIVELPFEMRSKNDCVVADLFVVTKTDVEATVENLLNK